MGEGPAPSQSAAHLAKGFLDHPDAFSHAGLRGLHLIDFLTEILAEICGLGQVGGGDEPKGRVPGDLQDLCLHHGLWGTVQGLAQPHSWTLWAALSIHLARPNAAEPLAGREVTGCCLRPATC